MLALHVSYRTFVFFLVGLPFPVLLNAVRLERRGESQFLGHQSTEKDKRGNKRGSWQIQVRHLDAIAVWVCSAPGVLWE